MNIQNITLKNCNIQKLPDKVFIHKHEKCQQKKLNDNNEKDNFVISHM